MQGIWGPHSDIGISGDEFRDAIQLHLSRYLGESEPAFIDSDGWSGKSKEPGPPVDVLVVPPEGERRFVYVASFGGAMKQVGDGRSDGARRLEFVLAAPQRGDQTSDRTMLNLAANTVRQFAKLAHLHAVSIKAGDTVAFSDNPEPMFEGSGQVAFAFMDPRLPDDGFGAMTLVGGEKVRFMAPVPIYRDELEIGQDRGAAFLAQALRQAGVTEMMDFGRPSVFAARKKGLFSRLRAFLSRRR